MRTWSEPSTVGRGALGLFATIGSEEGLERLLEDEEGFEPPVTGPVGVEHVIFGRDR